jgi:hypothetical protein
MNKRREPLKYGELSFMLAPIGDDGLLARFDALKDVELRSIINHRVLIDDALVDKYVAAVGVKVAFTDCEDFYFMCPDNSICTNGLSGKERINECILINGNYLSVLHSITYHWGHLQTALYYSVLRLDPHEDTRGHGLCLKEIMRVAARGKGLFGPLLYIDNDVNPLIKDATKEWHDANAEFTLLL